MKKLICKKFAMRKGAKKQYDDVMMFMLVGG
jgi:hypothetical protein